MLREGARATDSQSPKMEVYPIWKNLSFGVSGLIPNSHIKATVSKCQNAELGKHRLGKYQRMERI